MIKSNDHEAAEARRKAAEAAKPKRTVANVSRDIDDAKETLNYLLDERIAMTTPGDMQDDIGEFRPVDMPDGVRSDEEIRRLLDTVLKNMSVNAFAALCDTHPSIVSRTANSTAVTPTKKLAAALGFRPLRGWVPIEGFDDSALFPATDDDEKPASPKKPFIEIED